MALNPHFGAAAVNAMANAVTALAAGGKLRLYDGAQPAGTDASIGTSNLLAELTMGSPAFGSAVAGVITATAIASGTGLYAADATWFRLWESNGTTGLADGSVGLATSNCVLNAVSIAVGAAVAISSFTLTVNE